MPFELFYWISFFQYKIRCYFVEVILKKSCYVFFSCLNIYYFYSLFPRLQIQTKPRFANKKSRSQSISNKHKCPVAFFR